MFRKTHLVLSGTVASNIRLRVDNLILPTISVQNLDSPHCAAAISKRRHADCSYTEAVIEVFYRTYPVEVLAEVGMGETLDTGQKLHAALMLR